MTRQDQHALIVRAVTTLLVGLVIVWVLYAVRDILLILYVAGLFAIGISPLVRRLERRRFSSKRKRRLPRWAAILVLYLGLFAAVAGILWIMLPPLIKQGHELWTNLPDLADRWQGQLRKWGIPSTQWSWSAIAKNLPSPGVAMSTLLGALQSVVGAFAAIATVFVLPYYLLLEGDALQKTFLKLFDPERRPQVARITDAVTVKVGAWLGGQLLLAFVIGSTAAFGLWVMGVPYFWVLGLLAAIGELIPVVGPIVASIPAILVGFTVSVRIGILVAAYFVLQQAIENNYLVPRVMERQVGLSAVAVIIALLLGTELLGIVGGLLAVPSAAIAQVLFQELVAREHE